MVKQSTADPGIASSIPPPTKITKRRYVLVLPRKNAPVYQCFTLGTLKNLVCHVWWALQYLALWSLIETYYLYAPTPNGQSPSASLNKSNTPSEITLARGFGSVVKHSTADVGIASSFPPHSNYNCSKEICTGSYQEK